MKTRRLFLTLVFLCTAAVAGAVNFKKFKAPSRKFQQKTPVAVAGVRGLAEAGDPGDVSARDAAAVDWLEAVKISAKDLERFLKEGKLRS